MPQLSFDFLQAFASSPVPDRGPATWKAPVADLTALDAWKLTAEQRAYLEGPILKHCFAYDFPTPLEAFVSHARIEHLRSQLVAARAVELTCSDLEVAIYLASTVSAGPVSEEWTRIFIWSVSQVVPTYYGRSMPHDLHVERLNEYEEKQLLSRLRGDIRSAVVRHARNQKNQSINRLRSF